VGEKEEKIGECAYRWDGVCEISRPGEEMSIGGIHEEETVDFGDVVEHACLKEGCSCPSWGGKGRGHHLRKEGKKEGSAWRGRADWW